MTDWEKARLRRLKSKEKQGLLTASERRQLDHLKMLDSPPENKMMQPAENKSAA